jgi:hypothetical protein
MIVALPENANGTYMHITAHKNWWFPQIFCVSWRWKFGGTTQQHMWNFIALLGLSPFRRLFNFDYGSDGRILKRKRKQRSIKPSSDCISLKVEDIFFRHFVSQLKLCLSRERRSNGSEESETVYWQIRRMFFETCQMLTASTRQIKWET